MSEKKNIDLRKEYLLILTDLIRVVGEANKNPDLKQSKAIFKITASAEWKNLRVQMDKLNIPMEKRLQLAKKAQAVLYKEIKPENSRLH